VHTPAVTEKFCVLGLANSEYDLPCLDGCHCRRSHLAPDSSNSKSWLHASYEDQLDFLTHSVGLRAEVLARTDLGSLFQHDLICDRHLYQYSHQEEEACCFEEEGQFISGHLSYKFADNACSTTETGGAHLQVENISHLDRVMALKPFSLRHICQATA
jgi:hypothetical protein